MGFYEILIIIMLVVGICSRILSKHLEKKYKNKMNDIAEDKKAEKY